MKLIKHLLVRWKLQMPPRRLGFNFKKFSMHRFFQIDENPLKESSFLKSISTDWSSFSKSWYTSYIPSWMFEDSSEPENEYAGLSISYLSSRPKIPWHKRLWRRHIYPFLYYISEPKRVIGALVFILLGVAGYFIGNLILERMNPTPGEGFSKSTCTNIKFCKVL